MDSKIWFHESTAHSCAISAYDSGNQDSDTYPVYTTFEIASLQCSSQVTKLYFTIADLFIVNISKTHSFRSIIQCSESVIFSCLEAQVISSAAEKWNMAKKMSWGSTSYVHRCEWFSSSSLRKLFNRRRYWNSGNFQAGRNFPRCTCAGLSELKVFSRCGKFSLKIEQTEHFILGIFVG